MSKAIIAGGAVGIIALGVFAASRWSGETVPASQRSSGAAHAAASPGLLYGRITSTAGEVYEGRLRFGADEEALWSNYFNGYKPENPWIEQVPDEALPRKAGWKVFGIRFGPPQPDLGRPFMARFGDIARIDARGRDLRVTLRSGTVVQLDRYAADDLADGVRVWDPGRGVLDLHERRIRSIELLPAPGPVQGPQPLYGTVRTRDGQFTGMLQWEREACLDSDQLHGIGADGLVSVAFDDVRSVARGRGEGAVVTLRDGRQIVLTHVRQDGQPSRGVYVDDPRYGRVLVSWDAFERLDLSPAVGSVAYDAYPAGRRIAGSVLTRSGRRIAGRLVFDLDESENTETLDFPAKGVDYSIPFGILAAVEPVQGGARVTLRSGEVLLAQPGGDLTASNAGMLIFADGRQQPDYVAWSDVRQVDF